MPIQINITTKNVSKIVKQLKQALNQIIDDDQHSISTTQAYFVLARLCRKQSTHQLLVELKNETAVHCDLNSRHEAIKTDDLKSTEILDVDRQYLVKFQNETQLGMMLDTIRLLICSQMRVQFYNNKYAIEVTEKSGFRRLIGTIEIVEYASFMEQLSKFETKYSFDSQIVQKFRDLNDLMIQANLDRFKIKSLHWIYPLHKLS